MATAPYGVRLLVGAAVTVVEETKKLPQTVVTYPMTVASSMARMVMKMQQDLAELAIKGDAALDTLFPPHDEQPAWATFDEDLRDEGNAAPTDGHGVHTQATQGRYVQGRYALYSQPDQVHHSESDQVHHSESDQVHHSESDQVHRSASAESSTSAYAASAPPIVCELDYASLTLAQLRARLTSLSVADLEALLAYEHATTARAPFQTLLANRITRATAT